MERAGQKSRTMVSSQLCRVDADKRRGHSGKAGCKSVGETLYSRLQHRWNEFRVLQGRSRYRGKYHISAVSAITENFKTKQSEIDIKIKKI